MAKMRVCGRDELQPGTMVRLKPEGMDEIVVANVNGKVYAMRGICNHQGGPLAEGELSSNVITCPWHGAQWDVTTGKLVEFPLELEAEPVYKVTEEDDGIFVEA